MASVKTNLLLNAINSVTRILFPVVTFPYASRVLLPEGIGIINFQQSIISYIVLLTSLGIPLYAVKEVSKYRDNILARNEITLQIMILSVILSMAGYLIVFILGAFVPDISEHKTIFWILSASIIFNALGVDWFYQGVEDFKFITIRAIIVRTLCAVSIFLFVKTKNDLIPYAWITVASTVGNNLFNFIHLNKYLPIKFIKIKSYNFGMIFQHIRPILVVFVLNLIISFYVQLNTVMLGFMKGDVEVGYFTAGSKIVQVVLMLTTSVGTVLLPRCSNLLANGDDNGFSKLIIKSIKLVSALSYPITIALMLLSYPLILLFCGKEFMNSVQVLIWNAPVIIFISLTNILGLQILYPKGKISLVIKSVIIGAVTNIVLNLLMIPYYAAIGASISSLISEFAVLVSQMIIGRKYYPFKLTSVFQSNYLIASIVMGVSLIVIGSFVESPVLQLLISSGCGILVYFIMLLLLKDQLLKSLNEYLFSSIQQVIKYK